MQQAARVSDFTAFFYQGRIVEFGDDASRSSRTRRRSRPRTTSPAGSADRRGQAVCSHDQPSADARSSKLKKQILASERAGRGAALQGACEPLDGARRDAGARRSSTATSRSTRSRSSSRRSASRSSRCTSRWRVDLRFIIAVLKINNDLERIGDLAVNIAERADVPRRRSRRCRRPVRLRRHGRQGAGHAASAASTRWSTWTRRSRDEVLRAGRRGGRHQPRRCTEQRQGRDPRAARAASTR